jgi:uncharacterized protein YjbI with pentapeptide repeats
MTDLAQGSPETETPVNPYSLLEAVNRSSDTAHTSWLIFLAIMTYFMIAVAGVTHKDLLLETPVSLPMLQVDIPISQFFQFAPVVLVLLHLGLVSQLTLLARETLEFDHAIRLLEATDKRTHPLRLELNNFFFVQAIAGPHRSKVMSTFLHGMSWLTLVVLPVVLLLYIQVVFLPYHDVAITWTHRIALLVDIAMLVSIGLFLMRAEPSFLQALKRTTAAHPLSFFLTVCILIVVTLFSFFVATIPGEALDKLTQSALRGENEEDTDQGQRYVAGYALPFLTFGSEGTLFGIFQRNLNATDVDFVVDKDQTPGEPSVSMRGRDFRFAKLDRSDLHQADLTGADLRGASLTGADLRGAWLQCADVTELLLTEDRVSANCTTASRADFTRARLEGAHLAGVDLRNAKLEEARLEGAELAYSLLTGANLSSARLEKADLTGGVQAIGANFLLAGLQGADMTGAKLHGADFSSASLQGAVLNYAHLRGAILRDADLEAAALNNAHLEGADLTGAKVAATDFRGAGIWLTRPPEADTSGLVDLTDLSIKPLGESDITQMKQLFSRSLSRSVKSQLKETMAPLLNLSQAEKWNNSPERARWQALTPLIDPAIPDGYETRLTEHLIALQCKPRWSNGSVATGIARRAQAQRFRGDLIAVYDGLKAPSCPASKSVPGDILRDLGAAADLARSN